MKKSHISLLLFTLAIILAGFFAYENRTVYSKSPLKMNSVFDNMSRVISDTQDNLYLIDKSKKRILVVDSSGTLKKIIQADYRKEGSSFLFTDIETDANGFLYVLNTVLDPQGYYVDSEEINRYTPEGNFDRMLYRVEYSQEDQPIRTGQLKALKIVGDFLYFYSLENRNGNVLLNRLSIDGKDVTNVFAASLHQNIYLTDIAGVARDTVFYTTQKGNIYKFNSSGESALVYSSDDKEKSLPVYLDHDPENRVYFADVGRREINRLNPNGNPLSETIFSEKSLNEQGYDIPLKVITDLNVKQDGSLIVAASDYVIGIEPDGKIKFVTNNAIYPLRHLAYRWFVWLQPLLVLCLVLCAGKVLYVDVLQRKLSLLLKQALFVPIILLSMIFISRITFSSLSGELEAEMYTKMKMLANAATILVDGDKLERITRPGDFRGEDYRAIQERVSLLYQEHPSAHGEEFYFNIAKLEEGQLRYYISDDDSVSPYTPFETKNDDYYEVFRNGRLITGSESDADGDWMYAVGPIRNSAGKIVGALETGMDKDGFNQLKNNLFLNAARDIAITTTAIVALFLFMNIYLLKSIRVLRNGVNEVASGNWNVVVSVKSKDEVAELCDGFNKMSEFIRQYISEITSLGKSYYRFVPQRFVEFLGKESIADVQLGDQVKQEMSILYSSVHSFNTISKTLTPEESFNLINAYLKRVGPIIREQGGFIEKYLGSGIAALFPGEPGDALRAAVGIRRELEAYNDDRLNSGHEPLDIGIGIHRCPLMLGIIGEEKRLQGTVVSDAVDLAAAMERSSSAYGASVLITEKMLVGFPEQYRYRFLGSVQMEGKGEPVNMYDLFEGDVEIDRKRKQDTKDLFEEGIKLYQDGRFYDARSRFVEVIKQNYRDEAAKRYFYLCDDYFKKGAPEGWDGILYA